MPLDDRKSPVDSRVKRVEARDWYRKFGRSAGVIPHVWGIVRTNVDELRRPVPEFH